MINLFDRSSDFSADDAARLRRVERKLDLILAHLGLEFTEPGADLPETARALAERGDTIAAIKAYREATGARLAEAKRVVDEYRARHRTGTS